MHSINKQLSVNNKKAETEMQHDGNIKVCGADSFMLRDGVCDEATNNELCLWDGGDCCVDRSKKGTSFCKVRI